LELTRGSFCCDRSELDEGERFGKGKSQEKKAGRRERIRGDTGVGTTQPDTP